MKSNLLKTLLIITIIILSAIVINQRVHISKMKDSYNQTKEVLTSNFKKVQSLFNYSIGDSFRPIQNSQILYEVNGDSIETGSVIHSGDLVLRFSELSCNSCVMSILEKIVSGFLNRDELPVKVIGNGDNEFYDNHLRSYFNKVHYFVMKGGDFGTQLDSIGLPFLAIANRNNDQIFLDCSLPITDDFSVIDPYLQKWIKWRQSDFSLNPTKINGLK